MVDDEKTRWAIDVMTAWVDHEHDREFIHDRVEQYLSEPQGSAGLISGLVNLSGLLLMGLEIQSGRTSQEILQAIATTVSRSGIPPQNSDAHRREM
ncbi:hypothetical protein [Mycolicibacterium hippocampi]|uniref:Uncharacterized protein n=1 Tax=Mycolicibacterium hippocampi TaxID=659824 RepID=A0A850Q2V8_9MYCO|nr:hypothetical protein [Mycolicibacterium hippocampi]NVN53976.1 hypothetical protein [Mycolicibacterium hippocampi]